MPSQYEIGKLIREARNLSPEELEALAESAKKELALKPLTTVQDIKDWWEKYYLQLGHKVLGRMLLGKPPKQPFQPRQSSNTSQTSPQETPESDLKPRKPFKHPDTLA